MTAIVIILALLALLGLVYNGLVIVTERWRYADDEPRWFPGKAVDVVLDLGGLVKDPGIGGGCLLIGVPIVSGILAGMLLLPDHMYAGLAMLGAPGLHLLAMAGASGFLGDWKNPRRTYRPPLCDALIGLAFLVAVALVGLALYLM